jgi:uncharacterized phage protein (TIGR02220 family)
MTNKKPFVKINIEDLEYAKEFFDNIADYSIWLYAVTEYYQGNEVAIKKKIVKKYFDNYKKTMNIVIEAKEFGKQGALKRIEKQQVNIDTLEDPLQYPIEDSLAVNNKDKDKDKEEINYQALLDYVNKSFGRNFKIVNDKIQRSYKARLKEGYVKEDIIKAIKNCKKNKYHKENNYQYCTPEYFSRSETLDKYADRTIVTESDSILAILNK